MFEFWTKALILLGLGDLTWDYVKEIDVMDYLNMADIASIEHELRTENQGRRSPRGRSQSSSM